MNLECFSLPCFMNDIKKKGDVLDIFCINSFIDNIKSKYEIICPICLLRCSNPTYSKECSHTYCYKCIKKWCKIRRTCPVCRRKISKLITNKK